MRAKTRIAIVENIKKLHIAYKAAPRNARLSWNISIKAAGKRIISRIL